MKNRPKNERKRRHQKAKKRLQKEKKRGCAEMMVKRVENQETTVEKVKRWVEEDIREVSCSVSWYNTKLY